MAAARAMPSQEANKLFEKARNEDANFKVTKIEHRFISETFSKDLVESTAKAKGSLHTLVEKSENQFLKSGFASSTPIQLNYDQKRQLDDYINFVKTPKRAALVVYDLTRNQDISSVNGIGVAYSEDIADKATISFVAQVESNGNEWLYVNGAVREGSRVFSCTEDEQGNIEDVRTGFVTAFGNAENNNLNTLFYVDYPKDQDHFAFTSNSRIETAQQLLLELNKMPTINQAVTRALSLVRCKCTHLPDAVGIEQLAGCCPADQRTFSLQAEVVNNFATLCIACFLQLEQLRTRSWKSYNWSKETTKMIAATTTFFERVDFVDGRFKRRRKRHFDWS